MRKKIIGSSWKMHINSIVEGEKLAKEICNKVGLVEEIDIFILPTYPLIKTLSNIFRNSNIKWGAQNVCAEEKGAYTGEVPINILNEIGCKYIEIGHAERKAMFNENDYMINKKVKLCEKYNLTPIICIGETKDELDNNVGKVSLKSQVLWALDGISKQFMSNIVFAYEPVWSIGQAKSASPEYVQDIHKYIRDVISNEYGKEISDNIRIIYGGSVSSHTAPELIKYPDIDGLFIGRFGLDADQFKSIIKSAIF